MTGDLSSSDEEGPASSFEALAPLARVTDGAAWAMQGASSLGNSLMSSGPVQAVQSAVTSGATAVASGAALSTLSAAATSSFNALAAWTQAITTGREQEGLPSSLDTA